MLIRAIAVSLVPCWAAAASASVVQPDSGLVVFGADTVVVEVADEYAERVKGLQGRTVVPDGTGMLFVFDEPGERSFWMRGTPIDLDIAFVRADSTVARVTTMTAQSPEFVRSGEPVLYAVEVRAGWFAERGVREGDRVGIVLPGR